MKEDTQNEKKELTAVEKQRRVSTKYVHQKMFMGYWRDEWISESLNEVTEEHRSDKRDYPKRKFRMIKRVEEEISC